MNYNLHGIQSIELHKKMGYFFRFAVMYSFAGRRSSSRSLLQHHENLRDALLADSAGEDTAVPKGYLAVYVGPEMRRFVIPTSYLSLPAFRALMELAEEEFGFQQTGGLRIPCDEDYFDQVIKALDEEMQKLKSKKERS